MNDTNDETSESNQVGGERVATSTKTPSSELPQRMGPKEFPIQDRIVEVLKSRGIQATSERDLMKLSGIKGTSFKEALIRLRSRNVVTQWKNESFVKYYVLSEFANQAFYDERVQLPSIYSFFGHSKLEVEVRRSVPFTLLPDEETGSSKRNRYREQD